MLERAGKLLSNQKTLTALPVVLTPNDDITAYLSTNIMSITDGQIIFDLGTFRRGVRPAVNAGLSVSRVGGQAQNARQKKLTQGLFEKLAKYHQAEAFSHFGSSLSAEAGIDLELGKQILRALHQRPEELYSLVEQELVLETILKGGGMAPINVEALKKSAKDLSGQIKDDKDFERLVAELYKKHAIQPAADKPAPAAQQPVSQAPAPAAQQPTTQTPAKEEKRDA